MTQQDYATSYKSQQTAGGVGVGFSFHVTSCPGVPLQQAGETLQMSLRLDALAAQVAADIFSSDAEESKKAVAKLANGLRNLNETSDDKVMSGFDVPAVQIDDTQGRRIEIDCNAAIEDLQVRRSTSAFVLRTENPRLCTLFNKLSRYLPVNAIQPGAESEGGCGFGGDSRRERFYFMPPLPFKI